MQPYSIIDIMASNDVNDEYGEILFAQSAEQADI